MNHSSLQANNEDFSPGVARAGLNGSATASTRADLNRVPRALDSELPPIQRISMAPRPLERRMWPRLWRRLTRRAPGRGKSSAREWRGVARRRRVLLGFLVLAQTLLATWSLTRTFPAAELSYLQLAILTVFAVLFSWISFSFWSNVAGFLMLWRKAKIYDDAAWHASSAEPLRGRTAILMPICNEDARRCFAAIETMARSLSATGESAMFDFFVLSDSATEEQRHQERKEWNRTKQALQGTGRVFYRHRRLNIKRKSGNIADFLRRWSRPYKYMIVLDADSLMSGEAMVRLARAMDASPRTGILQTTPTIVNGDSLFARVQQFASRVYGPLFSASLHFWLMGESYYWGHNAIIRIAPFLQHCALARLSGSAPLGGEILSHDFVEAALMGRADYEVWLALNWPGSYEESPPTLLDELKRDRRWCQGNLQHARLLLAEGVKPGHRAIFAMGIMAYASALCWAVFLVLTTIELSVQALIVPDYFPAKPSLFPIWPTWNPEWAIALASTTALLLFLPKLLSLLLIVRWGEARRFGGAGNLAAGILLEIVVSTLLAPLRMWFHAKYVLVTLLGKQIKWSAQQRVGAGTSWRQAASAHAVAALSAGAWLLGVAWFTPAVSIWVLPVAVPLILSIPLSVIAGSTAIGQAARRAGVFAIPEERFPPSFLEEFCRAGQQRTDAPSGSPAAIVKRRASSMPLVHSTRDPAAKISPVSAYRQTPPGL